MMPYNVFRFINLKAFIRVFMSVYSHSVLLKVKFGVEVIKAAKSCGGGPGKPRFSVTAKNTTTKEQ